MYGTSLLLILNALRARVSFRKNVSDTVSVCTIHIKGGHCAVTGRMLLGLDRVPLGGCTCVEAGR